MKGDGSAPRKCRERSVAHLVDDIDPERRLSRRNARGRRAGHGERSDGRHSDRKEED